MKRQVVSVQLASLSRALLWGVTHFSFAMVQKQYAPAEGTHKRRMSLMTETIARGALEGSAFPPTAKCPDFPLATFFYLDAAPTDADLMTTMRKIVAFENLKSKVVPDGKKKHGYVWEEVVDIEASLAGHVTRVEVQSEQELCEKMDALLVSPLDTTRPLWDVCVLTLKTGADWVPSPGGPKRKPPVVCVRVSHAVGDGLSLVNVLTHLTDGDAALLDFKRRSLGKKTTVMQYMTSPSILAAFIVWVFNCIAAVLAAVSTPVGRRDSHTAFYDATETVRYSGSRKMITCEGFKLADIKAVKTKFGCTVNDVVCACLAGALHRYDNEMTKRNESVSNDSSSKNNKKIYAKTPYTRAAIAIPFIDGRPKDPLFLCNRWTFVSLVLATGFGKTIVDRLRLTKRRCDLMKTTPAAHALAALNVVAANLLGPAFQSQTIYDVMSKHTMVFTNVPGPTKAITLFNGKKVQAMTFAVSNLINQVSVMSYDGAMGFSLVVDPEKTVDSYLVGEYFADELKELMAVEA